MNDTRFNGCGREDALASLTRWHLENDGDNSRRIQQIRRCLRHARETALTPRQQQMVSLYYDRALTMQQIADLLGVCPSTVSRTLQRAHRRLQNALRFLL